MEECAAHLRESESDGSERRLCFGLRRVSVSVSVCVCVCAELLFLRILSCNTIFQRLAAENCRGPVLSLGVTGQRRHPQGGVKTYLLAGSLFRDASQRS